MRVRATVRIDIDPFEFNKTVDEVSYPEISYILKNHPEIYEVESYETEPDADDDYYEQMLANEARREQDFQVSEYYRGLM